MNTSPISSLQGDDNVEIHHNDDICSSSKPLVIILKRCDEKDKMEFDVAAVKDNSDISEKIQIEPTRISLDNLWEPLQSNENESIESTNVNSIGQCKEQEKKMRNRLILEHSYAKKNEANEAVPSSQANSIIEPIEPLQQLHHKTTIKIRSKKRFLFLPRIK